MNKEVVATGSRLEPSPNDTRKWSYPIKGKLYLNDEDIQFNEWVIPHAHIKDAVLNTERLFIKKQQSLLIDSDNNKYMFNLFEHIDNEYSFPFNVRTSEKKSFIGKLIIFGIVIFIINIIIDIVQYVS